MFFKLFILFTVIPFIELALLIKIGTISGTLNTIILILVTGVIGALMVRAAGIQCLFRIQNNMQSGVFPADELFNGVLILISGALLITPGLITDVVGFLLLFPPSREIIKTSLKRYIKSKLDRSPTDISINIQS